MKLMLQYYLTAANLINKPYLFYTTGSKKIPQNSIGHILLNWRRFLLNDTVFLVIYIALEAFLKYDSVQEYP
jgi:hypothetical protein